MFSMRDRGLPCKMVLRFRVYTSRFQGFSNDMLGNAAT